MLKTFEVGKIYRIQEKHSFNQPPKHIFVYNCHIERNGIAKVTFKELGNDFIYEGHYTDPRIWEEVNAKAPASG